MGDVKKRKLSDTSSEEEDVLPTKSFASNKSRSSNKIKDESVDSSSHFSSYNPVATKLMQNMGFKLGSGLGKHGQGRVDIIKASTQKGVRGLGFRIQGLEPSEDVEWNSEDEVISVKEEVEWIPECLDDPPQITELTSWMKEGQKKLTIDDEDTFCSASTVKRILSCKNVFDELEPLEMRKARTRSNPFETVRGVIFQNRAAMKMANMDAVFDFMFTSPTDPNGVDLIGHDEPLYFADICAGPGGFSEYVLWRKKYDSKGFGFTLKGSNDFKLDEFFAGPAEMFEPFYGVDGIDGNGDVFIPENEDAFKKFVMKSTEDRGVHFVMADGGFSVEGQENIQEILSKQLYLCQFMFALSILRTGGHFICKLFDIFTTFSVGLIYLMFRAFKSVCIHKPNTSRPANSERYIICKWRRENTEDVHDYMSNVNCRLQQLKSPSHKHKDIVEVVPTETLTSDSVFYNYIVNSNESLAAKQIVGLSKIKTFAQNTNLIEATQGDIRKQCLEYWQVPDEVRCAPKRPDPNNFFHTLLKDSNISFVKDYPDEMTAEKLNSIQSVYDYRCMVSGIKKKSTILILGLGRSNVYSSDEGRSSPRWRKLDLTLELPKDTLVFAEIVQELQGEGRAQKKVKAVHILDALFLGGKDVRSLHFTERLSHAEKLAKAVSKPSRRDYSPIRVKEAHRFEDLHLVFERLDMRIVKGCGGQFRLCYMQADDRFFLPTGLYFIKTIEDPWTMAYSRSNSKKYFFNKKKNEARFDSPKEAISNFRSCFVQRIFWSWEPGVQILDEHSAEPEKVHKSTILNFVDKRCPS